MRLKIIALFVLAALPAWAISNPEECQVTEELYDEFVQDLIVNGKCGCESSHRKHSHNHKNNRPSFGYFYADNEPVILYGEKIPFNHKTIHTKNLLRNIAQDEIIFEEPGSYLITINLTAKRIAVQTGTRIPVSTVSGGYLIGLFLYEMDTGVTFEIPGTRYGVLTAFDEATGGIDTQQLFAQVVVKIRRASSRISIRSLTPIIVGSSTTTAMQLQNRVSNPDFIIEPNVSASMAIQKL